MTAHEWAQGELGQDGKIVSAATLMHALERRRPVAPEHRAENAEQPEALGRGNGAGHLVVLALQARQDVAPGIHRARAESVDVHQAGSARKWKDSRWTQGLRAHLPVAEVPAHPEVGRALAGSLGGSRVLPAGDSEPLPLARTLEAPVARVSQRMRGGASGAVKRHRSDTMAHRALRLCAEPAVRHSKHHGKRQRM